MPLKDIAGDYIRANFRPNDRLAIVLIHKRSGVVTTRVSTAEKIASPEYQTWLKHMNSYQNAHEVFISMNALQPGARGRTKAEIGDIRHVYLDFDENGAENLKALREQPDMPEPNHIINSSPGKFQVVWRVEGFGKDRAEELMRGMSRATGADIAATDCARVLRLPGHRNHKYLATPFVTVENLSDSVYLPDRFPEFEVHDVPPERLERLPLAKGGKHSQSEHDWAFAMRAFSRGELPGRIAAAIEAYRPDKSDPHRYAQHTTEKAGMEYSRRSVSR
jgi:hypothetical protein